VPSLFRLLATRSLQRAVIRLLIGVLVFAQMTIAAYACPSLTNVVTVNTVAVAMPDCEQVDTDAAQLCLEHCRFGQQSADHSPSPAPLPALLTPLYSLPAAPDAAAGLPLAPGAPLAAVDPPHAILHCCLRT
jgi:hypothetical protein